MLSKALKLLFMIIAVVFATAPAFADADATQMLRSSIQSTVLIEKQLSNESGSINAINGTHSGLSAKFSVKTNEDRYKIILSSSIVSESGNVNAFGKDGRLLFANTRKVPKDSAVENARNGSGSNYNVIAYPVIMEVTSEKMSAGYKPSDSEYGSCWEVQFIDVDDDIDAFMTQTIENTPCANTYELAGDEQGDYQATVTITIVEK